VARARAIPGVKGAALTSTWPYGGWRMDANRPGMQPPRGIRGAVVTFCDENYLGLIGLNPLRGRAFTSADIGSAAHVAVISRTFAQRYFGEDEPIGQYIELPQLAKAPTHLPDSTFAIVGIVEDVRNQGLQDLPGPGVYLPTTLTATGATPRRIVVRAAGEAGAVVPALERTVRAVDLNVAVLSGRTLEDQLQRSFFAAPRFSLIILTIFATVGLLLVAVGVYGVMAYAVSRRTQEFAIRIALGATGGEVVRSVVRTGGLLLGVGIIVGIAVSRITNGLVLNNVVRGASETAPLLSGAPAVVVIVVVGLAACLIPAWRASKTSPMQALRQD
jgi:ABC-type antimicrobial peptide transport system permease subunit